MKLKKYTETQLRVAVAENISLINVLKTLGIIPAGGNYETLKKSIKYYSLDTSHFNLSGCGHLKGKTHNYNTRPLSELLVFGKYHCGLRKRLIREGVKKAQCEKCLLTTWNDKKIPLELHHIDGNRENNVLENLLLLCPNCHAGTENYRGRNKKSTKLIQKPKFNTWCDKPDKIFCKDCNKKISLKAKRCKSCAGKQKENKINWLPVEELIKLVSSSSFVKVAKDLGVSDNAVRKRIKNHRLKMTNYGSVR